MNEGDIAKPLSGIDARLTHPGGIFLGIGQSMARLSWTVTF